MAAQEPASPITLDEIKASLTDDEWREVNKADFMEPLKLYLEGIRNLQDFNCKQKHTLLEKIRQQAIQRTEVCNAIARNPAVVQTPLNPVVIIGLPRTGTTMLQRLLASAPQFVSPMTWEMIHPCPPGRPENWKECDRYQRAKDDLARLLPDGFDAMAHQHEINLEKPEECMFILQSYFMDIGLTMLPAMAKWKNFSLHPPQENIRNAYEYYKQTLQCIYYEGLGGGKLPLLKAPIHTLYLDMYKEVFPNVKFIFPYRNARQMIGSGCSIFSVGMKMMGFDVDASVIKKYILEYYRLASSRVVKALKSMPEESIFTVSYAEMVKDPMAAMKDLYSHFGLEMTPDTKKAMQDHMQENRQHKLGEHKYSLEQFGITEEEVRENLSEFLDYFGKNEDLL